MSTEGTKGDGMREPRKEGVSKPRVIYGEYQPPEWLKTPRQQVLEKRIDNQNRRYLSEAIRQRTADLRHMRQDES